MRPPAATVPVRAAPAPAVTLPAGAALAPGYEVIGHLSRGRALDVYDVWSEERQCRCVAKVLRPDRAHEPRPRRRLRAEGRLLLQLTHPHIVRAYELLERPDPVVILEVLEGETLDHLIARRRRRLPVVELAFLGLQLCSAIQYLHRHAVLHLDLKPSNVICEGGQSRVIDLSVARPPGPVAPGTGTLQYLSPEQARGGHVMGASDVWGIGAVLFEAATAVRPFRSPNGAYEQLRRRAEPVAAHRRVPPRFGLLVDACLEPDPGARPSLGELAASLEAFAGD
jgi:eukaryotic-like serine/threonine-protein kinase